jgi:uncharacterized membrane protein
MDLLNKIWENIKTKIKSPTLWLALILFLIKELEIDSIIQNSDFEYLVNKLINILVVLGIWSNPEKNIFNNKIKK